MTDHALISARVLTCLCPRDYAPEVPLLPLETDLETDLGHCPELRNDIGKSVPIYGVKYINYQIKTNLHQEVMYYVTDVRQYVMSADYSDKLGFSFSLNYFRLRICYDSRFIDNLTKKNRHHYWALPRR